MEITGGQSMPDGALGTGYTLERELGRGGMAAVYLAHDRKHHRKVAIKLLHPDVAAMLGAERFLQEIRVTAHLQHPHILGLIDSGVVGVGSDTTSAATDGLAGRLAGRPFYVMPFVAGESLRQRLEREGQLPVGDALRIAREVASALDYAHRQGFVHRDVKPENVLLGVDGQALVADFGIALAVEQAGQSRLTLTGLSLGTPAYMSPEQAMGERQITARSDVYSLGCVLYELLAGEPPFTGLTAQAIVARVLTESPRSLLTQRPSVPPHVDAAVQTALARLPADRFASAGAFARALTEPTTSRGTPLARTARGGTARPRATPFRTVAVRPAALLMTGALAAGVALGLGVSWARGRAWGTPSEGRIPVLFAIEVDSGMLRLAPSYLRTNLPAIAPDGRTIVYAAEAPDGAQLYARQLDELASRPLPGTAYGDAPFFAPDGAWVAFYSQGALRKVRLDGGPTVVIAEVPPPALFGAGSWGADDTLLYTLFPSGALYRVTASGGRASRVAVADTSLHIASAQLLPGGKAALVVTMVSDYLTGRVGVLDLATGGVRHFGPGIGARYAAGHLVYAVPGGELYQQAFDLDRLAPTGPAEQIATSVEATSQGSAPFDVSTTGTVVYRVGPLSSHSPGSRLAVTDRAGREQQALPGRVPWTPRFSPDGRRVAYGAIASGQEASDVWITDLAAGTTQRLTSDGNDNNDPEWSPDGRSLAYSAAAPGGKDLVVQSLDGGIARRFARPGTQWSSDWLRDGSALLFVETQRTGAQDLWVQPLNGGSARPYLATPAHEVGARVSPDGRWLAYQSDETGRNEVYVQSFPTPGLKTPVSSDGGTTPVWRHDGRELYYWQADQLIAARIASGRAGEPPRVHGRTPLFRMPRVENALAMYDVSPDGSRFVIVTGGERTSRLVIALDVLGPGGQRERASR